MRFRKMALWVAAVVGFANATAQAGLLPVTATVSPTGSDTQYTYSVVLTSQSTVQKGDYFTVYDFAGYNGSSTAPAGWTLTTANTGTTPSGISVTDNPTATNLTWTYTGSSPLSGQPGQSLTIGSFSAITTDNTTGNVSFAGQSHLGNGQTDNNVTTTVGPGATTTPTSPQTPEPASWLLLSLALPCIGLARWMRTGERGAVAVVNA